jgi:hypothetical protein
MLERVGTNKVQGMYASLITESFNLIFTPNPDFGNSNMETRRVKDDAATHRRKALEKENPLPITLSPKPKTSSLIL